MFFIAEQNEARRADVSGLSEFTKGLIAIIVTQAHITHVDNVLAGRALNPKFRSELYLRVAKAILRVPEYTEGIENHC